MFLRFILEGLYEERPVRTFLKELRSKYFILCATKSGYSKEKRVELDIVKGVLFLPVITLLLIYRGWTVIVHWTVLKMGRVTLGMIL